MSSPIDIEDDLWPLVRFRLSGEISDGDWATLFDAYDGFYERRERFAIINDSSALRSVPSPAARKLIGETSRRHEPMSRQWVVCSCVIITNPLMRGALRAITWVNEPAYPLHHVGALDDAVAITTQALLDDGIRLHPRLADLRRQHAPG